MWRPDVTLPVLKVPLEKSRCTEIVASESLVVARHLMPDAGFQICPDIGQIEFKHAVLFLRTSLR